MKQDMLEQFQLNREKMKKAVRAASEATLEARGSVIYADKEDHLLLVKEISDGSKKYFRLPKEEGQATCPLGPFK